MSEDKSYKDTLNLPKTTFDMKANLLNKEPAIQAKWAEHGLYGQIRCDRDGQPRFILHDGPPYANGNIHMGTAMNKVLKDIVIRVATMSDKDAPYIPGWDCHGLPIEQKVMEALGPKAREMKPLEIRSRCREYAEKFQKVQSEQFQRLGIMGEFDKPYLTMDPQYEADVLEVFARLVERGIVYKQLKPVHWSIANQTALADAELEYQDRTDTSIYVAFELAGQAQVVPHVEGDKVCLLIWTTTPWTLPANMAAAVHRDFEYQSLHVETAQGPMTLVMAASRVEPVVAAIQAQRNGWFKSHKIVGSVTGAQLADVKLTYKHPIFEGKTCPIVAAPYVTLEDGTGIVHTAPGHGMDDYGTGLKNGLDVYCPVMGNGTFDDTVPDWLRGVLVWKANPMIIERLKEAGMLVLEEPITHSYPHDWRSKTPTIFRATEQWFIAVDRPLSGSDQTLRQLAMDACRHVPEDGGVEFIPSWGKNRIAGMLESRPDWCISRQRSWGLPIPAFYNKDGRPLLTPATVRAVAAVFVKEGSDAWFTKTPKELLAAYDPKSDHDLADPQAFPIDQLTAGSDIFDVWFDAGSSWFAVAIRRELVEDIPVDLYLEGSDQHRGWFQLSLLTALGARGEAPFKTVLTHGYVVDETGRTKMSKSLGNVMNVMDQLKKRGADVLRLWVASQNYQDDVRCSEALIAQSDDAYRKIRNTLRFAMGACGDFDPAHHSEEPTPHSIDLWMRMEVQLLIRDVRAAYDRYEFHKAARMLYEFCTVQASSIYFSAVKDRLYCESPNAVRRRATQTVIHDLLVTLVKLLAPILPHTCDEAWDHIPFRDAEEPASVHMALLPKYDEAVLHLATGLEVEAADNMVFSFDHIKAGPARTWQKLLELRDQGLVKLEALRNGSATSSPRNSGVKNSLDAEAIFQVASNNELAAGFIQTYLRELEDLLGVGHARMEQVSPTTLGEGVIVNIEVADTRDKYKSCARSWKRRPDVGQDSQYPDLSVRDAAVMREIGR